MLHEKIKSFERSQTRKMKTRVVSFIKREDRGPFGDQKCDDAWKVFTYSDVKRSFKITGGFFGRTSVINKEGDKSRGFIFVEMKKSAMQHVQLMFAVELMECRGMFGQKLFEDGFVEMGDDTPKRCIPSNVRGQSALFVGKLEKRSE